MNPDLRAPNQQDTATPGALPASLEAALGPLVPVLLQRHQDALAVKDATTGAYVHVDVPMLTLFGRAASDVLGRTDADLLDADLASQLRTAEQAVQSQPGPLVSEHRFEWRGERREFSVIRQRLVDASGRALLAAVWHDLAPGRRREAQRVAAISQLEQQQHAYEKLRGEMQDHMLRDLQTGLYNRAHFEDQLRREVDLSTREHREFSLVAIELDPPTPEVVALGDVAGERIIGALGRLLRSNTRAMDASCRDTDMRFAVLLSGVGLATAHSRMEGLRRQCATQIVVHEGQDIGFTVSMGVASFPHTAHTQEELRAACDAALDDARRRGGNHVTLAAIRFDPA